MGKSRNGQMSERQWKMIEFRAEGKTYPEIGKEFGITASGARENIRVAARLLMRYGSDALPHGVKSQFSVDELITSVPNIKPVRRIIAAPKPTIQFVQELSAKAKIGDYRKDKYPKGNYNTMTDERLMELLRKAVEHIEAFEEDQSDNVLQSLGFTENDLAEIRFEFKMDKRDEENIGFVKGKLFHNGSVVWLLSDAGNNYIFSDQVEDDIFWRTENVPFRQFPHYVYIDEYGPEPIYTGYAWYNVEENFVRDFNSLDECLNWLIPEVEIDNDYEKPALDAQIKRAENLSETKFSFSEMEVKDQPREHFEGLKRSEQENPDVQQHIAVETPIGEIHVGITHLDPDYPGIFVDLKGHNVNAQFEKETVALAVIEFNPEKKNIQTLVWQDANQEDYTFAVEHENLVASPSLSQQRSNAKGNSLKREFEF